MQTIVEKNLWGEKEEKKGGKVLKLRKLAMGGIVVVI